MPPEIDSGDTAWMLAASALVHVHDPGPRLLLRRLHPQQERARDDHAELHRRRPRRRPVGDHRLLRSPSARTSVGGLIGDLDFFGLKDVGAATTVSTAYATTIPHEAFMIFQAMFAIITPALITGAFAERAKFSTFLVFMLAWSLLVYAPVAHWVFASGGWLSAFDVLEEADTGINALDFAGGTAIHVNAGAAALAAAILYGKRKGFGREPMEPHNVTYIVLGAAILWFGWFGFNAGSAGAANGVAANAFVVTNTAAAAAALSWVLASWALTGKASVIGAAAGAVAGLVAITPASGFVQPMEAIVIGGVAGVLCYLAVRLRATHRPRRLARRCRRPRRRRHLGRYRHRYLRRRALSAASMGLIEGEASQVGDQTRSPSASSGLLLHGHLHHPQGPRCDHGPARQGRRGRARPRRHAARRARLRDRRRRPRHPRSAIHGPTAARSRPQTHGRKRRQRSRS